MFYLEPPTSSSLADARRALDHNQQSLGDLQAKIDAAEAQLAQIVADSRCAINELQRERAVLEEKVVLTLAYISPIRRLPNELLRHIFLMNFDEYPCCAWILSAVCNRWRRLALSMPILWSKIRLVTSPNASADTIRLWLERSGSRVPLDIEIFLQIQNQGASTTSSRPRARSPSSWPYLSTPPTAATHYVQIQANNAQPSTAIQIIPTATPIVLPPSPPHHDAAIFGSPPSTPTALPSLTTTTQSRASSHWGHIAIFYLVEQMHRWERFVFRFDKQFSSWHALKSISGPAPMLKEFEVSCAEPVYYGEWPWLPSASPNAQVALPELRSLTLQYTPFKWSSPMLKTNLRSLNLRSLPTTNIPIDRILHIVSNNRGLEELSLHFSTVQNYVLPLIPTTLPELKELSVGGHYLMSSIVDSFILPALESLTLDIEARDPIEESITNLLSRSNHPPITLLSLAYGQNGMYYYSGGGLVASWAFLNDLSHLRTLQVGTTPLDPLLSMLGAPEEDVLGWLCPNLEHLALKNCPAHSDGIPKLVQMVDMRNPEGGASAPSSLTPGGTPVKLRQLEIIDCTTLGQDVVEWLKTRIEDVVCVDPPFERTPHSPTYAYL
ncbi:hypothetical protein BV25DRAFT_1822762 [Artomyces pyxidatus]|uniref:Uncharacterized protein n=1 Tax=Artomyces pyxidatus TaxID=48021 RepID=A0ACB8T9L8_9AGAM|nr:hypothetical protein BV25DRAFT_1822762 [Artomyces pyxidatus]